MDKRGKGRYKKPSHANTRNTYSSQKRPRPGDLMKTALKIDDRSIDIAPGFRKRVWQLLLDYFDYLRILDDLANEEPITHEDCSEAEEKLCDAANAIEREFFHLGLMHRQPLETVGITLIRLRLDGQEMHVRTLSMHWWRFVCEQLRLPFPLVLEMMPPRGPESYFGSN